MPNDNDCSNRLSRRRRVVWQRRKSSAISSMLRIKLCCCCVEETYPAKIMAVTADDIQRVARKYINPDNLQVVAVGDISKIKSIMEKYGPVEVYDAEGKKVGN